MKIFLEHVRLDRETSNPIHFHCDLEVRSEDEAILYVIEMEVVRESPLTITLRSNGPEIVMPRLWAFSMGMGETAGQAVGRLRKFLVKTSGESEKCLLVDMAYQRLTRNDYLNTGELAHEQDPEPAS